MVDKATPISSYDGSAQTASGDSGDGGPTNYRLDDLDRRVSNLENRMAETKDICIKIDTNINHLATKSFVLWIIVIAVALPFLTILGHLLIRQL